MDDELFDSTPYVPPSGPALYSPAPASASELVATSSELVSLDTIHNDIQAFHFSFLAVFCMVFVYVLIVRRFK